MEESSKKNGMSSREFYSNSLLALAFLGLGLKIPFILSVIIQVCLVVCTFDVAYRYLKMKNYVMCILKIFPLILVCLFDIVMYNL